MIKTILYNMLIGLNQLHASPYEGEVATGRRGSWVICF